MTYCNREAQRLDTSEIGQVKVHLGGPSSDAREVLLAHSAPENDCGVFRDQL